jgi:hypothetical protein
VRPTKDQITSAVAALGAMSFFPSDAPARKAIMQLIARMVGTKEQLDWLVLTMIDKVGEWKNPKELRGVYCSRFRPADGVEADCAATIEFTPHELAEPSLAWHEDNKLLRESPSPDTEVRALVQSAVRRIK